MLRQAGMRKELAHTQTNHAGKTTSFLAQAVTKCFRESEQLTCQLILPLSGPHHNYMSVQFLSIPGEEQANFSVQALCTQGLEET